MCDIQVIKMIHLVEPLNSRSMLWTHLYCTYLYFQMQALKLYFRRLNHLSFSLLYVLVCSEL